MTDRLAKTLAVLLVWGLAPMPALIFLALKLLGY